MAYISFQPSDYFNTLLYSGNSSTQALTGLGFEPDLIWIKNRDGGGGSHDHYWFDQVRGTTKHIRSNSTSAEGTTSGVTAFGSDGFTLGSSDGMNESSRTFASWNWRASGTSGSSNSDGSITSTVSANTTSGFSVVSYTGNESGAPKTVAHGLGVVPQVVLIKNLADGTLNWSMYHHKLGNTKVIFLNDSATPTTSSAYWNNTTPTSSVFTVNGNHTVNHTGTSFIAYCFAEVKGFSKFGSYLGLGASGNFIYCGFKPAFVMVKRIDGSANWVMTDNKFSFNGRGTHDSYVMFPSSANAETDSYGLLLVSNGFQIRGSDSTSTTVNGSGAEYIYWAFAEEPTVSSNGVPATAR